MITKEKVLQNKYTLRYITEELKRSHQYIADSYRIKEYINMAFVKEEDYEKYPLNINFDFEKNALFLDGSFNRKTYSYNLVELKSVQKKIDLYLNKEITFKNLEEYLFDTYLKKGLNLYRKSLDVDSNLNNYYKNNISFSDLNDNAKKKLGIDISNKLTIHGMPCDINIFQKMNLCEGEDVASFLAELVKPKYSQTFVEFSFILEEIHRRPDIMFIIPMIISRMDPDNARYYFFAIIRYLKNNVEIREKDKATFLNLLNKKENVPLYTRMLLEKSISGNKEFLNIAHEYLLANNPNYYYANKLMILDNIDYSSWLVKGLSKLLIPSELNANSILISDQILSGFRLGGSYYPNDLKEIFLAISKYFKNIFISKRTLYFVKEHYEFEIHETFPIKDENVTLIDQAPEEIKLIETSDANIQDDNFVNEYFSKYNLLPVQIHM